jgi:PHP family Zn ribbon phosphoesterase
MKSALDLSIDWKVTTDEPNDSPATLKELKEAMTTVRAAAATASGAIEVHLRREVAEALKDLLDTAGTAHCTIAPDGVYGGYDAATNSYKKRLVVAPTKQALKEACDW